MAKVERIREVLSGPLSPEYLKYQADAGWKLAEDPTEQQILVLMMELIVQDQPLSRVAEELNRKGSRRRHLFTAL